MEDNNSSNRNTILIVIILVVLVAGLVWFFAQGNTSTPADGGNDEANAGVEVNVPGNNESSGDDNGN